jgi:hypothetical protein
MTTSFAGSSNFSGFSGSATIYRFPPRGRFALRERDDFDSFDSAADRSLALPRGARLPSGSGWYHDEAIAAERSGKN